MMTVSVIVPVYNGARYLGACLDSILAQSCAPREVIVIDDGSTDDSAAIALRYVERKEHGSANSDVSSPDVSVLHAGHKGPGHARNRGIKQSRGDLICFLDADDLWASTKVERQVAAFLEDPALDLVSNHVQNFFSPELDGKWREKVNFVREPIPGMTPSAVMVRRSLFDRSGLFDEDLSFGDFIPWLARAKDTGVQIRMLDDVLTFRRIHESNFSRTQPQHRRDYLVAIKTILDRRRGLR